MSSMMGSSAFSSAMQQSPDTQMQDITSSLLGASLDSASNPMISGHKKK